ncbi:ADP-ribosylation/Crystallin J1 [Mycena rebaudengoi]|nr:ADP-ribosylation/Crystallin J1 [Mycena rebaudengoi]
MTTTLHAQRVTPASASTKIRTSFLATALTDALGAPAEFDTRFGFPFVKTMIPNETFRLPKGVWTDDTSMMLALGRAIAQVETTSDTAVVDERAEAAQLDAYFRWWQDGTLSATGRCFDIGNTIHNALSMYRDALTRGQGTERGAAARTALAQIARDLKGSVYGGNGSLMRVLPVGLAFHRDEAAARAYARRSSAVTHPSPVCLEACEVWTGAVVRVLQAAGSAEGAMTKLDLLHYFATFPYATDPLKQALTLSEPYTGDVRDMEAMEAYYEARHPIMLLRRAGLEERALAENDMEAKALALIPSAAALPSSGYVLHTLVAALYALLATDTFEEGALVVVNMGDDADTVGAVYGGLAGCWYAGAGDETGGSSAFWTPQVREWAAGLVRRDMVEEVAEELVALVERQ